MEANPLAANTVLVLPVVASNLVETSFFSRSTETASVRRSFTKTWEGQGVYFLHIYGPLHVDAVLDVSPLEPGPDGFVAPASDP